VNIFKGEKGKEKEMERESEREREKQRERDKVKERERNRDESEKDSELKIKIYNSMSHQVQDTGSPTSINIIHNILNGHNKIKQLDYYDIHYICEWPDITSIQLRVL
jgi:hypothetical protein